MAHALEAQRARRLNRERFVFEKKKRNFCIWCRTRVGQDAPYGGPVAKVFASFSKRSACFH
jgi:hypothetical protein